MSSGDRFPSAASVLALTRSLVSIPSAWPRNGEGAVERTLRAFLRRAGFRSAPAARPPLSKGRANLLAFRAGGSRDAILLTGHLDTVARDPLQVEGLSRRGRRQVLAGRGALDMKAGLAAGAHAAAHLALTGFPGWVLFLGVADEEGESAGMRAALHPLLEFLRRRELRVLAAINLDYADFGDSFSVYAGSVGKLLVGVALHRPARHASASRSSSSVTGDFARVLASVPLDRRLRESGSPRVPPPIVLHAEAVRESYSVSVPEAARIDLHVPFFRRTPDEILSQVALAVTDALSGGGSPSERVALLESLPDGDGSLAPRVASDDRCRAFEEALRRIRAVRESARPRAVLYLAPPVYPSVETPPEAAVIRAIRRLAREDREEPRIRVERCYPYISDLSYLRAPRSDAPREAPLERARRFQAACSRNLPSVLSYELRLEASGALELPILNVGALGGGAHTSFEWVDADSAFRRLPRLLVRLARELVAAPRDQSRGPRSRFGNPGKSSSMPNPSSSDRWSTR